MATLILKRYAYPMRHMDWPGDAGAEQIALASRGTHAELGATVSAATNHAAYRAAHQDALVPAMNQPVRKPFAQLGQLLLFSLSNSRLPIIGDCDHVGGYLILIDVEDRNDRAWGEPTSDTWGSLPESS